MQTLPSSSNLIWKKERGVIKKKSSYGRVAFSTPPDIIILWSSRNWEGLFEIQPADSYPSILLDGPNWTLVNDTHNNGLMTMTAN